MEGLTYHEATQKAVTTSWESPSKTCSGNRRSIQLAACCLPIPSPAYSLVLLRPAWAASTVTTRFPCQLTTIKPWYASGKIPSGAYPLPSNLLSGGRSKQPDRRALSPGTGSDRAQPGDETTSPTSRPPCRACRAPTPLTSHDDVFH